MTLLAGGRPLRNPFALAGAAALLAGLLLAFVLVTLPRETATPPDPLPAPALTVSAGSIRPGTPVTVDGTGFPAGARVRLYLGPTRLGAAPAVVGESTASAAGGVALRFTMPATWSNGEPIGAEPLTLVAATDDFRARAVARLTSQH